MGATYTRQSSYTDGDTITAAHTNDEFNQLLAAFASSTGHTHDGTSAEGGPITKLLGNTLTFGAGTAGTDVTITFDGETSDGVLKWMEDEDYFEFSDDILVASTEKLQFRDTAIYINSSTDGQLDLVADTEIQLAATTVDLNGDLNVSGEVQTANIGFTDGDNAITIADGGVITVVAGASFNDQDITNVGSIALDTITNDGTDITLDSSGDIVLDAGGANVIFKDDGTSILDIANNSSDVELTVSTADKNFAIKGTDGASAITALDIDMALAGKATFNGDVVVGGDLTISGDDLTMSTNTAGHLLIADGTNFNPVAVTSLSEISSIANDDVFLAVDTSGGGLKKVERSTIVAGLATSSALSNVSEDSTPQLGGNLDTNSHNILIDDAHFIGDENGNEQIIFQTTSSAVNQFDVTNAATGNPPKLSATGGDSNIDLDIEAKGTGHVTVRGNTNSGAIQFNCESNSHGQIVQAQPHSAAVTNTMLLPAGSSSTLVSLVSTDTLTNKTLTSPKINEDVAVTSTATELNILDGVTATTAELNYSDTGAAVGTVVASKVVTADANKDVASFRNITLTGELDAGSLDISGDADIDGTLEADAMTLNGTAITTVATLSTGISNGNLPVFTSGAADNDFLRIDGTSIEGRSASEVLSDISAAPAAGDSNIVTTGALNSGSITSGFGAIDNGSSAITTTGVITGGTVEATADTSAGDNAAIGYTAAEGLILTGQGSTSDITLKNDADTTVAFVPTGTDDLRFPDDAQLQLGDSADLKIYHNGSTSFIEDTGTGNFLITTNGNNIQLMKNQAEQMLVAKPDDAVELYFDNEKKFETSSVGVTVTGTAIATTDTDTSNTGNVTLDFGANQNFVLTLTGNVTLDNPSTEQVGQSGFIVCIQDGTGSRTLSLGTDYETAGGAGITLSTAASATDIIPYVVAASGRILLGAPQLAFS